MTYLAAHFLSFVASLIWSLVTNAIFPITPRDTVINVWVVVVFAPIVLGILMISTVMEALGGGPQ